MAWNENKFDPATIKDTWGTPEAVLDPIYKHFGQIGLDPCANPERFLDAKLHCVEVLPGDTPEGAAVNADGLTTHWDGHGLVYINPPYFDIAPWAHKAATEGDEVISLLPARTGSKWFQRWIVPADVLLFWKGRIKFHGATHIAPFHMTLSYWGPRPELFLEAFPGHWYIREGGKQ